MGIGGVLGAFFFCLLSLFHWLRAVKLGPKGRAARKHLNVTPPSYFFLPTAPLLKVVQVVVHWILIGLHLYST